MLLTDKNLKCVDFKNENKKAVPYTRILEEGWGAMKYLLI
jgi:hypothetical protein